MGNDGSELANIMFSNAECFDLFLAVDDHVRQLRRPPESLVQLREKLLPFYRARYTERGNQYSPG